MKWLAAKTFEEVIGDKFFAIVRHPVERWIAAMAQEYEIEPPDAETIESHVRRGDVGTHMQPQTTWLPDVEIRFFKLGSFEKVLDLVGVEDSEVRSTKVNHHTDFENKRTSYGVIKEAVKNNPGYTKRLCEAYSDDLDLFARGDRKWASLTTS